MEYRILGTSGIRVSRMGLGTMSFGAQVDEATSRLMIDMALDRGVNFLDTADVYAAGESERIVGRAIKGRRDRIVLSTKCGGAMSPDANDKGLSRPTILRHVDASLGRLGTDYLDLLFLHFPDPGTSLEDVVLTMGMLISNGKIRAWGLSNFAAWQCCAAAHMAQELHCPGPIASQNAYNLITRGLDDELVPFLGAYGMGLVAFNPLAGGLLTGKHPHGNIAPQSRLGLDEGYAHRYCKPANIAAADKLAELAAAANVTAAQLALKWILDKEHVTSVLCGASKPSQLEDNLDTNDLPACPEAVLACDALWDEIRGDYFSYHY